MKVEGLLGEKNRFFIPLGIQIEIDFRSAEKRINLHSFSPLGLVLVSQKNIANVDLRQSNYLKDDGRQPPKCSVIHL